MKDNINTIFIYKIKLTTEIFVFLGTFEEVDHNKKTITNELYNINY